MKSNVALLLAAALAGLVAAQNNTVSINPGSVDPDLRADWCRGQTNTCTSACGGPGQTNANDCDDTQLTFKCTCNDDSTPDIAQYSSSLPAFICQESVKQCVDAHPDDREAINDCRSQVCGNRTIEDSGDASSSSAPSATSATSSASSAASPTGSEAAATSTGAAVALEFAQNYGTGALAAGMLALFGLAM